MMWLVLTLLLPLLLAASALLGVCRQRLIWLLAPAALPALLLGLLTDDALSLSLPWILTGVELGLDGLRRPFLLLAGLLWFLGGGFATAYLRDDVRRGRFAAFWLLALAGNLGAILALDLVAFYTAFAVMTFSAYGLIIHIETPAAWRAGRIYLIMAVMGEGILLAGLFHAAMLADSLLLSDIRLGIAAAGAPDTVIALLLLGFGVKAGMALLHFWLPLAHPVAPTPASAVLSGVMIKAGLLGWMLFLPFGELGLPGWGSLLIALGVLGSLGAAVLGVVQDAPKTVLAYSSISQMGLLLMLLGVALAVPASAPALLMGVAFYALHHGLAKGALFLSTAVMPQTSGWSRYLLWPAVLWPALALTGMPLTSGAAAKLAVKEQLPEAINGFFMGNRVEFLLGAGAVATTLLMARFAVCIRQQHSPAATGTRFWLRCVWLAAVAVSALFMWILPIPAAVNPNAGLSFSEAPGLLWPVAPGLVLFAAASSLRHRFPIPAGDLIVPLEALYAMLAGWLSPIIAAGGTLEDRLIEAAGRCGQRILAWQPVMDHWERVLRRQAASLFMLVLALLALMAVVGSLG